MALTIRPVPSKEKSKVICHAFRNGAPRDAEGDVFFGTEGVMDAWQAAQKRAAAGGAPFWYVDNAYFDQARGTYFRVTKNALQVDHTWKTSTGERFAKLGVEVKPARQLDPHGLVLVIPQSDDFMKSTLGRRGNWTAETVMRLAGFGVPAHEIRVRPWLRDKKRAYVELREDLASARLVVTWSSASAITALLEGVPAISESGAAHALTGSLTAGNVLHPQLASLEERQHFANVLADAMFTLDEFRDGTAWRYLDRST